jgi:glycosyltransferase involved in cell wall biosynthesis
VSTRSVWLGRALAGGTLTLTACSRYCASTATAGQWMVVPNGVPEETYAFRPTVKRDAPLVFLGRVERIKGAHTAIAVARRTGRQLVIAGNRAVDGEEREYFEREIAPHCDGRDIKYVGPVTDNDKNDLLGKAAALLFPVEWGEPFGIVMVEALACGTPVIAFSRGAVPEVIEDGTTGVLCDSVPEMMEAVSRIPTLERVRCRESFERRFSGRVIVGQYEFLYRNLVRNAMTSRAERD